MTRLAALVLVALLAACEGESAFMAHSLEAADLDAGSDLGAGGASTGSGGASSGTGGHVTGSGGATAGTGGHVTGSGGATAGTGGVTGSGGMSTGTGGRITGTGGMVVPGTGGSGTGGTVVPGTGGSGGTGSGVVLLTVPFTAASTGSFFNTSITSMALDGHIVTFSMCVTAGTANQPLYTFHGFATDSSNGQGTYGPVAPLSSLTTCPTMTPVYLSITATNAVNVVGIQLQSGSATGPFGAATLEIDSISISGDPVPPFQFMSDQQGFVVNSYQVVPNSTVTWQAFP